MEGLKLTHGLVRLELVKAAVSAGRRHPDDIIAWARSLEPYITGKPLDVAAVAKQNAQDLDKEFEKLFPSKEDKELKKVFDFVNKPEEPKLPDGEPQRGVPRGNYDDAIKKLWYRDVPVAAIAIFLGVHDVYVRARAGLMNLPKRQPFPRGLSGSRLKDQWIEKLREEAKNGI